METFEQYLEDIFVKGDGRGVLDDDIDNAFDSWLQNLDADEFLKYGNEYGELRDMLRAKNV